VKLYQRRDVNETLSSTLEVVLRQIRVPILQSNENIGRNTKRENLLFSSLSGLYLLKLGIVTILQCSNTSCC